MFKILYASEANFSILENFQCHVQHFILSQPVSLEPVCQTHTSDSFT